jgi:erythromycin esterase
MMADNLTYIAEHEKSRGKLFAFAHNSHLKRGQAVWQWGPNRMAWWPAGAHLSASMGSRYAIVGVAAGTSSKSNLCMPEAGTLEARLLAAPGPARIIPTHRAQSLDVRELPVRTANPQYFPLDSQSLTDFDFLAVLDEAN